MSTKHYHYAAELLGVFLLLLLINMFPGVLKVKLGQQYNDALIEMDGQFCGLQIEDQKEKSRNAVLDNSKLDVQ